MNPNHRIQQTHIDGVLTDFFRAETPDDWPDCPQVKAASSNPVVRPASAMALWWRRSTRQFAVAAAIALLLGGYWLLSHQFPDDRPQGRLPGPNTALRELETKGGNRFLIIEEKLPNGGLDIRVHPLQNLPIPDNLPDQP